ncbi:glycine-rich domain-containing protein [Sphingomonas sp. R1]|uniref:glycine-rich domain-containing protein n=1 Tax=Sphingomonas sp. R1 TaxID=399176 RepID=UPI002223FE2E|nr:hypothetical protein [Sphingomonas sp. R1]UYY78405.1 hypothetical protein OIM94_05220 [Sphingomonas sp. R1]
MARAIIGVGDRPNDNKGDTDRDAWIKANGNFEELYAGRLALLVKTADYVLAVADVGQLLVADASAGAMLCTLPTAGFKAGDRLWIRKFDASANRVTVRSGAIDLAWLSARNDSVSLLWTGSAWLPMHWNIAPLRFVITGSGSAASVKPPLATSFDAMLIGGGGGGGSGRCGALSTIRTGGGGGAAGAVHYGSYPASIHGTTEQITIGAGGARGAGVGTAAANGNSGTAGGTTLLGTFARADGGAGGAAGSGANGAAAVASPNGTFGTSGNGSAATSSATPAPGGSGAAGGGGAGGSMDASNVIRSAASGGAGSGSAVSGTAAGANGISSAPTGGAGTSVVDTIAQTAGGGGGGGAALTGATGAAGGSGGTPGGGGGGGGACDVGFVSGAGGDGGRGEARVIWYF